MRLADKVFNTRGRPIKVGTSYGSVSQLQTSGTYVYIIVILLNDKSLEESIRLLIIPWTLADSRSHAALVATSVEDNEQRSLLAEM